MFLVTGMFSTKQSFSNWCKIQQNLSESSNSWQKFNFLAQLSFCFPSVQKKHFNVEPKTGIARQCVLGKLHCLFRQMIVVKSRKVLFCQVCNWFLDVSFLDRIFCACGKIFKTCSVHLRRGFSASQWPRAKRFALMFSSFFSFLAAQELWHALYVF